MDDWEQHFVEKSRRRADKERAEERRRRNGRIAVLAIGAASLALAIGALAILR